jgi:hypothetical protein
MKFLSFEGNTLLPEFSTDNKINIQPDIQIIINRATLQDNYLMLIDKSYACDHSKNSKIKYCSNCNTEKMLIQSEGLYVCNNCGETEHVIIESEIPSHKDAINEKPKYPYKKINHLKEKLNQFQSKESAEIPEQVYDIIKAELKKKRILPYRTTPPIIRTILKKRKLTNCYEHLQQIYCKVSGNPPVTLTREIEEDIINMFNMMQEPYHKHRPGNRSNFLNYSYVLHKLFLIKNMKAHANYFGLLKSPDKLREQDDIWYKICQDTNWHYHSSL